MAKNAQIFHFYLRTSKNSTVPTYINLVSLINGKRLKFYTEMDIPPCMWDKNLERCIVSNAQKDRQNREATKINNHLKFPYPNDKTHSIRHLKKIGELANIDDEILVNKNRGGKIISSKVKKHDLIKNHTGRRSFATNLYKKGMSTYIKITLDENADLNRKYFRNNNSTGLNLLTMSALRRSKTDFGSLRLANLEEEI